MACREKGTKISGWFQGVSEADNMCGRGDKMSNGKWRKNPIQFDSLIPKSPLLEGQLSVLVGIKGPGNDDATFSVIVI